MSLIHKITLTALTVAALQATAAITQIIVAVKGTKP